jgi:hypothetical protein
MLETTADFIVILINRPIYFLHCIETEKKMYFLVLLKL